MLLWPSEDMDFWKIESDEDIVTVKWSHNYFEDYKILSYQFFECGNRTFDEVIEDVNDNIKSDMWFLPGIFLIRQSIELGLKALLCRIYNKNKDIQNTFEECCHDVSKLFQKYIVIGEENYLTNKEREWLINYLLSLEDVDSKSDMFRFKANFWITWVSQIIYYRHLLWLKSALKKVFLMMKISLMKL